MVLRRRRGWWPEGGVTRAREPSLALRLSFFSLAAACVTSAPLPLLPSALLALNVRLCSPARSPHPLTFLLSPGPNLARSLSRSSSSRPPCTKNPRFSSAPRVNTRIAGSSRKVASKRTRALRRPPSARPGRKVRSPSPSLSLACPERDDPSLVFIDIAGLVPSTSLHLSQLLTLPDSRAHAKSPSTDSSSPSFVPSTVYTFELFTANDVKTCLAEEWPEKEERERKWVSGWEELVKAICWGKRETVMRSAVEEARKRLS